LVNEYSLPLSALQHWLFCPRQCALIHVEKLWEENRLTAEGRLLHERADKGIPESRDGINVLRAVHISSSRLGLHGIADVVEMRDGLPFPIEYKRGRPKTHRADEVQLCAQAICLEEMTGQSISEGALFYGACRRRQIVAFDDDLRMLTRRAAIEAHEAMAIGALPPPLYDAGRCESCSLNELCRPQAPRDASGWMIRRLSQMAIPE